MRLRDELDERDERDELGSSQLAWPSCHATYQSMCLGEGNTLGPTHRSISIVSEVRGKQLI